VLPSPVPRAWIAPGIALGIALGTLLAGTAASASGVASPPPGEGARFRLGWGLESAWFLNRFAFWGLSAQLEVLPDAEGIVALVVEGSWVREQDGDDEVLLLGMAARGRFALEGGGTLTLEVGLGWLRWRDPYGWDRGTWNRIYRKLSLLATIPLPGSRFLSGLPIQGFLAMSVLPPWFYPVLSVGFSVPVALPGP